MEKIIKYIAKGAASVFVCYAGIAFIEGGYGFAAMIIMLGCFSMIWAD